MKRIDVDFPDGPSFSLNNPSFVDICARTVCVSPSDPTNNTKIVSNSHLPASSILMHRPPVDALSELT